jgi:DNA-binding SARP family transcriptional activator
MVAPRVTDEFSPGYAATPAVLTTRLGPPQQQSRILPRPRLDGLLAAAAEYPLTTIIAPAGSGKTTALAALAAHGGWPVAWCRLVADDSVALLARHLAAAFRFCTPLDEDRFATGGLDEPSEAAVLLVNMIASALDDETLLVLDDFHHAAERPALRALIEALAAALPPRLHLLLAARSAPSLTILPTARARGEVLQIAAADLAFTADETAALFTCYGHAPPAELAALTRAARGWPLALQLAAATPDAPDLSALASPLDAYFTREVLAELTSTTREALLRAGQLRWIDEGALAVVDTELELLGEGLFEEQDGSGRRCFQPLFKAFLERVGRRELSDWRELHLRFATYYEARGDVEGALHHLVAGDEMARAATLLEHSAIQQMLPPSAVVAWAERMPECERGRAGFVEAEAAVLRAAARFELALERYATAENAFRERGDRAGEVRALLGQAAIYVDTVQPAPGVALLKQAFKLLPREQRAERAALLRLQAENWANRGRADVALLLERAAHVEESGRRRTMETRQTLPSVLSRFPSPERAQRAVLPRSSFHPAVPSDSTLSPRLLLRSGRLHEARHRLEHDLGLSPEQVRPPTLLHREPLLLLALIDVLLGSGARALATARRALHDAQHSGVQLTEAIALMRLGHALQLVSPRDAAAGDHYRRALEMVQSVGVPRSRAEAYLGLTLLAGHSGDLPAAESHARDGLYVAELAGDEWMVALLWLALGGAAASAADQRAFEWLEQARRRFARGGDEYGQAVVALWLAWLHLSARQEQAAAATIEQLLLLTHRNRYEELLRGATLFGPRDEAMLLPVLLRGRQLDGAAGAYAHSLLRQHFPAIASDEIVEEYHPGFTLRVQMLGSFRVWRGDREIHSRDWQREKARQLLQLLLTHRGMWLQREQICAWLWPESDVTAAERQFKVTLNALNAALELQRPPRTKPFFIRRQGLAYSFAPSYGCWIDVDEFELRTAGPRPHDPDLALRSAFAAVQLYRGSFLAEALYDPWTTEERERLLARYLAVATQLAEHLCNREDYRAAAELCEQVLRHDAGYEEAYQTLMRAHARAGSRSQALRAYARCVQALQSQLGIEPLPETTHLLEQIKRNEPV